MRMTMIRLSHLLLLAAGVSWSTTTAFQFGPSASVPKQPQRQLFLLQSTFGVSSSPIQSVTHTSVSTKLSASSSNNQDDNENGVQEQPSNAREEDEPPLSSSEALSQKLDWKLIASQIKVFWSMAYPYYQESKAGRWLFAGMIGLTLLNSGVSVAFSYLGKDFWNALSAKNTVEFYQVLTKYVGALVVGAPIVTLYKFQRERLALHWREWMTDRTLQLYEENRVYYALERNREVDNPDQRICEDVKSFTSFSLQLFLTIVTSIIDLVSFSLILYSIYPQLFIAIVAYSAFGTVTTGFLGKDLVRLNYEQLSKEADFRYSLVRLRDNAESIAFYAGEDLEGRAIQSRLKEVISNTRYLIRTQRNLEFFTNFYRFMIQLLPVTVVAPRYFAGAIELGVISQSVGAFNHILNDLSIIVNQFEQLSRFSAGIERLSVFLEAMRTVDPDRGEGMSLMKLYNATAEKELNSDSQIGKMMQEAAHTTELGEFGKIALRQSDPVEQSSGDGFVAPSNEPILSIQDLDLCTPDRKRLLIQDLSLNLKEGQDLLIVGNSGAGKSSLLRAIAGLWTDGNGSIDRPNDSDVYFLPQRPYCTVGTLKDQLLYPSLQDIGSVQDYPDGHVLSQSHLLKQQWTDQELLEVLDQVDLGDLAGRSANGDPIKGLNTTLDWSNVLSLGEQQRLAFGRVLVNRPKLVILDEATSALDMVAEAKMYTLLRNMAQKKMNSGQLSAPGLTYISVGHRPSLLAYHDKRLRVSPDGQHSLEDIEKTSSVDVVSKISNL